MKTFLQYYKIDENKEHCHFMYRHLFLQQEITLYLDRSKRWVSFNIEDNGFVVKEIIEDSELSEETGWYLQIKKSYSKIVGRYSKLKNSFLFLLDDGYRIYR